jgi:hypothetical protein
MATILYEFIYCPMTIQATQVVANYHFLRCATANVAQNQLEIVMGAYATIEAVGCLELTPFYYPLLQFNQPTGSLTLSNVLYEALLVDPSGFYTGGVYQTLQVDDITGQVIGE